MLQGLFHVTGLTGRLFLSGLSIVHVGYLKAKPMRKVYSSTKQLTLTSYWSRSDVCVCGGGGGCVAN